MTRLCQICSHEPSKYRCPVCQLSSCSLACSQSHKKRCTSTASEPAEDLGSPWVTAVTNSGRNSEVKSTVNSHITSVSDKPRDRLTRSGPLFSDQQQRDTLGFTRLESSPELEALWHRFPLLRPKLREIYKITLETEWVEIKAPIYTRGRGRGKFGYGGKTTGPWTPGKGCNRGLYKVRKWRESCEDGVGGVGHEGFMQFAALVLAKCGSQEGSHTQSQARRSE